LEFFKRHKRDLQPRNWIFYRDIATSFVALGNFERPQESGIMATEHSRVEAAEV
jgi:hypothetical protein